MKKTSEKMIGKDKNKCILDVATGTGMIAWHLSGCHLLNSERENWYAFLGKNEE